MNNVELNQGIIDILDLRLREFAREDMLEEEYDPMIELDRQLKMVIEDGDWGEDFEEEIKTRMNVLCKSWYIIKMTESFINKESCPNNKFELWLRVGIYHEQNHNLTEPSIPIGASLSEKRMRDIKEWAQFKLIKD